jgi:glutathione S-transferase
MMAAKLYQFLSSPFCAKVRKILDFKGIDYEVVEVDYLERKELLTASNQLMVPALTLDGGETVVDSARIALRLEELCPEPTILPPGWSGMHRMLADYIDNQLEDVLFKAAIPDEVEFWRSRGRDREALWRLVRDRKYGSGFVERMIAEHGVHAARAREALAPFEEALSDRAFLLGRIGLADFALYGQLFYFAFLGELKIPADLARVREYFGRMDRISSAPEAL